MVLNLNAFLRPLRKLGWIDGWIRRTMDVLRQWPFIVPRAVVTSAPDWVTRQQKALSWFGRRTGPWYREIYPMETRVFPISSAERGDANVEFHTTRVWLTPACGLYYLDGAYVLSPDGAVMSGKRELFDEFSHTWNLFSLRNSHHYAPFATFSWSPKRIRRLAATIAAVSARNYYHWMFNVMPRIHLLESVWDSVDFFIVPPVQMPFQAESLAIVGMPEERMIQLDQKTKYVCERIFVPSMGPHDGSIPRWSIDYLRRTFLPPSAQEPATRKKLYLSRDPVYKRALVNELEVRKLMADHDFEIVVPHEMTICEQAAIYAQASHLVGPHGAAFTNMIFSTDALVAEIFAPSYIAVGCYHSLSVRCGHRYDYFVGDPDPSSNGGEDAMRVDLGQLEEWLVRLLESTPVKTS